MKTVLLITLLALGGLLSSMAGENNNNEKKPAKKERSEVGALQRAIASGHWSGKIAEAELRRSQGKTWLVKAFEEHESLWQSALDYRLYERLSIDTMLGAGSYTATATEAKKVLVLHSTGNTWSGADAEMHANAQCRKNWDPKKPRSWHFSLDGERVIMSYDPTTTDCSHVHPRAGNWVDGTIAVEVCQFEGMNKERATDLFVALAIRLSIQFPGLEIQIHREIDPRKGEHTGCPSLYPRGEANEIIRRVERALKLYE